MKGLAIGTVFFLAHLPATITATAAVPPKIAPAVRPFPLEKVRLLPGPFQRAMELDHKYLLSLDVDRLLHMFRVNAGLPSTAQPLGGWEEPKCEVRGHFLGHYLSACALMYASTADERLKDRANRVVAELARCQKALGNGYLSAYPESFIDRVETLKPVWAPWYTLHKIFAGLLDVYVHCGNQQALEVAGRFADWVQARSSKLSDPQMQKMLENEHGGMNEVLANLYGLTGQEKYLQLAQRFNHRAVLGPASKRQDRLTGLHANTQIPKFVGTARQYELTGQDWLRTASRFFWDTVVNERSYVIGGHSDGEMFSPKEKLSQALGANTTETCNTYNVLKLTRHLFCWEPRVEYADYYERALYNHILASQNPATGMMCYYVPLRSGSHKVYNSPLDSFWCCTGTGVENHAKYGDSLYFHDGSQSLYWNLFIPSTLDWKEAGLKLRQETNFPDEGRSRMIFSCDQPVTVKLHIRRPFWATTGFTVAINGRQENTASKPGSYTVLERTWKDGDTVEVALAFSLRTEAFRDNPQRLAFLHGPLVLAAEVKPGKTFPFIVAEQDKILAGLQPVPGRPSTFMGSGTVFRVPGQPGGKGFILEPFFKIHGGRSYLVYWDVVTPDQWQHKEKEFQAEQERRKKLAARTVDEVRPGEEDNERDHKLRGEQTGAGDFSDRKWRHALNGGWFSYEVKVLPGQPQELIVTYWGSDVGARAFDILVDGQKLATQKLQNNWPGRFHDQIYSLTPSWTPGKRAVVIRFQAHAGCTAGGIFGLRMARPEMK